MGRKHVPFLFVKCSENWGLASWDWLSGLKLRSTPSPWQNLDSTESKWANIANVQKSTKSQDTHRWQAELPWTLRGAGSACLPSQCSQPFHICSPLFRSLTPSFPVFRRLAGFAGMDWYCRQAKLQPSNDDILSLLTKFRCCQTTTCSSATCTLGTHFCEMPITMCYKQNLSWEMGNHSASVQLPTLILLGSSELYRMLGSVSLIIFI